MTGNNPLNVVALTITAILMVAQNGSSIDIESNGGYSRDVIPTVIWDTDIKLTRNITPGLSFAGRLHYLDYNRPSMDGIKALRAQVGSGLAGLRLNFGGGAVLATAQGGVDVVDTAAISPRFEFEGRLMPPVYVDGLLSRVTLTPTAWYTRRIVNAMAVRNGIISTGFSAELSALLGTRTTVAGIFRREYMIPRDTLLDTNLFESRSSRQGFAVWDNPELAIRPNYLTTYAAYAYTRVLEYLYIGYAFSWKDSRYDRYMKTGGDSIDIELSWSRPGMPVRVPPVCSYYPYTTPIDESAHLAIIAIPLRLSSRLTWESTLRVPIYASKRQSGYQIIQGTQSRVQFTLYNTAVITEETKLTWALSDRTSLSAAYEYFCFPYTPWGYFTSDRYFLHTWKTGIRHNFGTITRGGKP